MKRRLLLFFLTVLALSAVTIGWRLFSGEGRVSTATASSPTQATILALEEQLARVPDHPTAHTTLGLAYLQRLRETGDLTYYGRADEAFHAGAKRAGSQQFELLLGRGMLALSRHRFQEALALGRGARAQNAYSAPALGIIVDAYVEMGRYEEATDALQMMVNLRPDLASYSRVAYLRELHGDSLGALAAMQLALDSAPVGSEPMLWALLQVGDLHFGRGELQKAEGVYRQLLSLRPDHPDALAGLAEVAVARGHHEKAIAAFQRLAEEAPAPDVYEMLGNLYDVRGEGEAAQRAYGRAIALYHEEADAGVDVSLELARFYAEQGIAVEEALQLARHGYAQQPTFEASDVLAWAYYQNGDYESAWRYNLEARRAGARDPHFFFHAGMIALARGEEADGRALLAQALDINPYFSLKDAATARALLGE